MVNLLLVWCFVICCSAIDCVMAARKSGGRNVTPFCFPSSANNYFKEDNRKKPVVHSFIHSIHSLPMAALAKCRHSLLNIEMISLLARSNSSPLLAIWRAEWGLGTARHLAAAARTKHSPLVLPFPFSIWLVGGWRTLCVNLVRVTNH